MSSANSDVRLNVRLHGVEDTKMDDVGEHRTRKASGKVTPEAKEAPITGGIALSFTQIKVEVQLTDKEKSTLQILKGIDGQVRVGEMIALMGASGAGKTTLLNVLSGRSEGKISGDVSLFGRRASSDLFRVLSSYVTQDDILPYSLTAEESFRFTARMRLSHLSRSQQEERVEVVLRKLGLTHVKDTVIGEPGIERGISGGERKRVNVGNSLISNPKLLFMDEPTSGLDSTTALKIMKMIGDIVIESKQACISTIHQPNAEIFNLFNRCFILAQGQVVYFGPTADVEAYFSRAGYPMPAFKNPADHAIDLVIPQSPEDKERVKGLIQLYADDMNRKGTSEQQQSVDNVALEGLNHRIGICEELQVLFSRAFSMQLRHKMLTRVRMVQMMAVGLLMGILYLQASNDQSGIVDKQGALFMICAVVMLIASIGVLFAFPAERALFIREYQDGTYGVGTYFMAKVTADVPFQLFFTTVFCTISFFLIGFRVDTFSWFLVTSMVLSLIGASVGFALSGATGSVQTSLSLAPMIFMTMMLFSGFLVTLDNITWAVRWISYANPLRYGLAIFLKTELNNLPVSCKDSEMIMVPGAETGVCPIYSGNQILERLEIRDIDRTDYLLYLIIIFIALRALGWLTLYLAIRKYRK